MMTDEDDPHFALYKLFVATTEKVADRRARANGWMLSINSAIVALYGYLQSDDPIAASDVARDVWLWAIPAAGILVCMAWFTLLRSYRTLNHAKFAVLKELEDKLAFPLFTREEEVYQAEGRIALSKIESAIPWTFAALYLAMVIAAMNV